MSNKKKQKGYRLEHFLEKFFVNNGIFCQRRGLANQEDLLIIFNNKIYKGECKNRKDLKRIYDWLDKNNFLFIKWSSPSAKNKPILVVLRLEELINLLLKDEKPATIAE